MLSVWIWGGYPKSGRAIHRAEALVGDSCATFKVIGPVHAVFPENDVVEPAASSNQTMQLNPALRWNSLDNAKLTF